MGSLQTYHGLMVLLGLLISKLQKSGIPSRVTASHIAFADYVVVGLVTRGSRKPLATSEHVFQVCVLKFRIGSCFLRQTYYMYFTDNSYISHDLEVSKAILQGVLWCINLNK